MQNQPPGQPPGGPYGGGPWGQPSQPQQQPQGNAWGQPQQPQGNAWGQQPQQPQGNAWGQPQQPQPQAWGQPSQPQAWGQPSQPQPGAFGGQSFGAQPMMPQAPMGPPRAVGFFDSMPCPHCGAGMSSTSGGYWGGGLVGWLLMKAIASKYYCPSHGEVPTDALPPEHRSVATTRRLLMAGGALAVLVAVFGCIFFGAVMRSF